MGFCARQGPQIPLIIKARDRVVGLGLQIGSKNAAIGSGPQPHHSATVHQIGHKRGDEHGFPGTGKTGYAQPNHWVQASARVCRRLFKARQNRIGQLAYAHLRLALETLDCHDISTKTQNATRIGQLPRYALKIEYDGAPFHGWQRQVSLPSVQGAIEAAVRKLEPESEGVTGAGRTDTGVHAAGQVAHVDMQREWEPARLCAALNAHLRPKPVAILDAALVDDDFHARFSAIARHYRFRLFSRRAPLTYEAGCMWQVRGPLDLAAMQAGAAHMLGTHDFTTFRSSTCQAASAVKTLDRVDIAAIEHSGGVEFRFELSARSFLHNQVRSIVGTLERVGHGAWAPDDVRKALAARDRAACGPVCPPHGLYLMAVDYLQNPFA